MMNSQVSNSTEPASFNLLDQRVQQWIWRAGWTELRDAQDRAIPLILKGSDDVIIAASTAAGKTEAAFFPILTKLAQTENSGALVVYISPLKALINDQYRRLEELAATLQIEVTPWHGDVGQQRKTRFLKTPRGVLLITPESLEALLARRGHGLAGIFSGTQYFVIDELHAFMGTERGKQLQSLLHRTERAVGRRICRIGLSATLGDMQGAAEFLRSDGSCKVSVIDSKTSNQELKVLVKGILESTAPPGVKSEDAVGLGKLAVAKQLFQVLRGSNNLVFPNSRRDVEYYSASLRQFCEDLGLPNEFWPHHGNLSKEIREEGEAALKQTERPATAICTSTLELGIDIGPVKAVVQVGAPPSVASLRQRLGRSGRRKGEPMILRAYCIEPELTAKSGLSELLREGLVCTVAMIRLLASGWYEPICTSKIHGSTLVQQALSTMAQYGAAQPQGLWDLLCATGPFSAVTKSQFLSLLQKLGEEKIIFQDATGLLLLAPIGEQIVAHYTFFAAFDTVEEFRIICNGKTLGSMPITRPLSVGSFLIFAGKPWAVLTVDQKGKVVEVQPAKGGAVPNFDGNGTALHDHVREEMRNVLRSKEPIPFLDAAGQEMLREARDNYDRLDLDHKWILQMGNAVQTLLWRGDCVNDTLVLMLQAKGFQGMNEGISISIRDTTQSRVRDALAMFCESTTIDPVELASKVENKIREKWDGLLPEDLLSASFASANLDVQGAKKALQRLL